jgi:hypothetical protein
MPGFHLALHLISFPEKYFLVFQLFMHALMQHLIDFKHFYNIILRTDRKPTAHEQNHSIGALHTESLLG